jgi:AcrR family transcriptional regulator
MMPSSTTTVRRTQAERRGDAERALLDAAARLFARRGIDQTSLADIGQEAGYSRGLVNHHFGSKAALVERLTADAQRSFVAHLPAAEDRGEIDTLVGMAGSYLEFVRRDTTKSRAFFVMWGAALPFDASLRPVFVTDDARFRDGIADVVRTGQRNRIIDPDIDATGFAVAFVGLVRGITAQFLVDPDGVDVAAGSEVCERFIRAALIPRPATAGGDERA